MLFILSWQIKLIQAYWKKLERRTGFPSCPLTMPTLSLILFMTCIETQFDKGH